jgi:hypothetical protein
MRSFLVTAAAAGASYLWRNRATLRSRTVGSSATPSRGVTIYDNHPVAE